MFDIGAIRGLIELDDQYTAALEKAANNTVKVLDNFGNKAGAAGAIMSAALTVPIVGFGAAAIRAGTEFESAMNGIQGVLRPTAEQINIAREASLQLGADTVFSATDAAHAMLELGKAGFSTKDAIGSAGEVMKLAAASGMTMSESAEMAARTLNMFGLESKDLAHVNDVLATAVNKSSLGMHDLQIALPYVGSAARALNVSIEDTSAMLAMMRDSGTQAETAGRALREMFSKLLNPLKSTKDGLAAMNLTIEDFRGADGKLKPISDILETLAPHANEAGAMLKTFGDVAGIAVPAMLQKGIANFHDFSNAMKNSDGAAQDLADAMMHGLPGAIEQLRGSVDTLFIKFSKAMEPAILGVLGAFTSLVNYIAGPVVDTFMSLPVPIQMVVGGLLAITASIGPMLLAVAAIAKIAAIAASGFGVLVSAITAFNTALVIDGALVFDWGATMVAIPGIGAAVTMAIEAMTVALEILSGPWGWVAAAVVVLAPLLWEMAGGWDGIKESLKPVTDAGAEVVQFFKDVITIASYFGDQVTAYIDDAAASFGAWLDSVNPMPGAVDSVKEAWQGFVGWFKDEFPSVTSAWDNFVNRVEESRKDFGAKIGNMIEWVQSLFVSIQNFAAQLRMTKMLQDNINKDWKGLGAQLPGLPDKNDPGFVDGFNIDDLEKKVGRGKIAIGELTKEEKAAAKEAERLNDIYNKWTGVEKITELNEVLKVTGSNVGILGDKQRDQLHTLVEEAISASERTGKEIPTAWYSIWEATQKAAGGIEQFIAAAKKLPTEALPSIHQIFTNAIPMGDTGANLKTFSDKLFGGLSTTIKTQLGPTIMAAITGGGNVLEAIGGLIGGKITDNISQSFGESIGASIKGLFGGGKFGGMIGDAISSFIPGIGAAIGPLVSKGLELLGNGIKKLFGGPSAAEQEGRKLVDSFEQGLDRMLTSQQKLESGGVQWKMTTIAVRDAYLATGKTAAEAMHDVERLWAAEKAGPEAVKKVMEEIQTAFDEQAADQERLQKAYEKYNITASDRGPAYALEQNHLAAKDLIEDWRVLVASGIDVKTVNERMTDSVKDYIITSISAGIEIPNAMEPIIQSMMQQGTLLDEKTTPALQNYFLKAMQAGSEIPIAMKPIAIALAEQGLLVDENGEKLDTTAVDSMSWSKTMTEGFNDVVRKLQELIDKIGGIPSALDQIPDEIPDPFRNWNRSVADGDVDGYATQRNSYHVGNMVRAHTGLAVDEVPILAQRGEGILSKGGMRRLGGTRALNALNDGLPMDSIMDAPAGGSGRPIEITVISTLDGRQVAKSVVRRMPDELEFHRVRTP